MIRVTPSEPFCDDPDARYLRESPGPLAEQERIPGRRLVAVLLALIVLSCSACSAADAAHARAVLSDVCSVIPLAVQQHLYRNPS